MRKAVDSTIPKQKATRRSKKGKTNGKEGETVGSKTTV